MKVRPRPYRPRAPACHVDQGTGCCLAAEACPADCGAGTLPWMWELSVGSFVAPAAPVTGTVAATITLDGDVAELAGAAGSGKRAAFVANFTADVAAVLGNVTADQVAVHAVAAGSTVCTFWSVKCLNWSIVTRAHAPRQVVAFSVAPYDSALHRASEHDEQAPLTAAAVEARLGAGVRQGLGRIVASRHRPPASHQIR